MVKNESSQENKKCDCKEYCERSGINSSNSKDILMWWTPYLPLFVQGHDIQCRWADKENSDKFTYTEYKYNDQE